MIRSERNVNLIILIQFIVALYAAVLHLVRIDIDGYPLAPIGSLSPNDTFMDLFNTNSYAFDKYVYEDWKTLYLPFVFAIARLFVEDKCQGFVSLDLRGCSLTPALILCLVDILTIFFVTKYIRIANSKTLVLKYRLMLTFAIFMSLPNLFMVERGNFIVLCLPLLLIVLYQKNDYIKCLSLALTISLKIYLLALVPALLKLCRSSNLIIFTAICFFAINFVSLYILDFPSWDLFVDNILLFASSVPSSFEKLWFPTSVTAWLKVTNTNKFEDLSLLTQFAITSATSVALICVYFITLLAIYSIISKRSQIKFDQVLLVILILILINFDSVGSYGYTLLLIFFPTIFNANFNYIIPMLLFLIFSPIDIEIGPYRTITAYSFWSGNIVQFTSGITLLAYMRPIALLVLSTIISHDILQNDKQTDSKA